MVKLVIKRLIKHTLGHFILASDMLNDSITIFVYHDVTDKPSQFSREANLNVEPQRFEQQLRSIQQHFTILTIDQLTTTTVKGPKAIITFDDGLESYFTHAVPILNRLKIPSINFINGATLHDEVFWASLIVYLLNHDEGFKAKVRQYPNTKKIADYLRFDEDFVLSYLDTIDTKPLFSRVKQYCGPFLSMAQLNTLADNPNVLIGNHLYNHFNAYHLNEQQLSTLYQKNQTLLNQLSNSRNYFAYPFGQPDSCIGANQTQQLQALGAKLIFSSGGDHNKVGVKAIYDRIGLYHKDQTCEDILGRVSFERFKKRFKL